MHLDTKNRQQIADVIGEHRFDEVYNLAARSSSTELFDDVVATGEINGLAVATILEAIHRLSPATRFCQASTSEVFAGGKQLAQDGRHHASYGTRMEPPRRSQTISWSPSGRRTDYSRAPRSSSHTRALADRRHMSFGG